ncbi:Lysyl oxidase [Promicromonospora umidemergens]|uniref:Lysyl oxidase family protein n=1 Tax=Promicromonospora umidemergens TaxID=629679 RepID=A0ABP8WRK9_9MICO|nr:lysyl oxidase family protein [Promicromonospora umidemergens]MCP2283176.1 Lysyl oxidase [Promicromonospora umidemergens]
MGIAAVLAFGLLGEGGATHVASASTATTAPAAPTASAQHGLSIAPAAETVTAYNYDGYVYLDSSFWLAAHNGSYEFWAKRTKLSEPTTLTKTVIRGTKRTTTKVPASLVDGFNGLKDGLTVQVATTDGKVLSKDTRSLCLGGMDRQRVDPTGRTEPVYPSFCGGAWFTKSTVFGVEQGWAAQVDAYFELKTKRKNLVVTTSISAPVAKVLGLPANGRSLTQKVKIVDECDTFDCANVGEQLLGEPDEGFSTLAEEAPLTARAQDLRAQSAGTHGTHGAEAGSTGPEHRVNLFALRDGDHGGDHPSLGQQGTEPSTKKPAKDTLPDLVSMPAWEIGTENEDGTDRLSFSAHEWNAGPAPLVVEGYRKGSAEVMDAHQFFYRDGKEVGNAKTGTMEYHDAPEHDHWHFLDFASYELVKTNGDLVTTSGKQSWCLVPTDPVDLSVPGAAWRPEATGLDSSCGDRSALWLREVLPAGWGDTYSQYQTQAFDLTDVRNGTYQIKITVNPNGALHERTKSNNISYRTVVLGGKPGARTVKVPAYEGVDTETPLDLR